MPLMVGHGSLMARDHPSPQSGGAALTSDVPEYGAAVNLATESLHPEDGGEFVQYLSNCWLLGQCSVARNTARSTDKTDGDSCSYVRGASQATSLIYVLFIGA
jgi:hypothetical protein